MEYVAGFLFKDQDRQVLLIRKNRPEWQKGKLNGVGGKMEPGETPEQAMRREFLEEAGIKVPEWREFCTLHLRGDAGIVHFMRAYWKEGDLQPRTMEDEQVNWYSCRPAIWNSKEEELLFVLQSFTSPTWEDQAVIPNLRWILPLAKDLDQLTAHVYE